MNTIRMIAIALPVMLLTACGGGGSGGGGTAAAPTTLTPMTMMPPGTNDPMNPGTGDPMTPPPDNTPATLPTAPINATTARGYFTGSTIPSAMDSDAIEGVFRSRASATGADVLFEDIIEIGGSARTTSCNGTTCTGTLSDNTALEYSFSEFGNTPEINSQALLGFNDDYSLVMTWQDVTLAQGRAAGRLEGTSYRFLNYGGWLTNSAFGVQHETADGSGNNDLSYITAYSFGIPSGSNPNLSAGVLIWDGAMTGANTQTGDFIQGQVEVLIGADAPTFIGTLGFTSIRNLNTGEEIDSLNWSALQLDKGSFLDTTNGTIEGTFYGTGHTEIGGTFNRGGFIGAFGATRR